LIVPMPLIKGGAGGKPARYTPPLGYRQFGAQS
jgi:hypothetical protein